MTNHKETRYGKGDMRRPENTLRFAENFEAIFGKKSEKDKRKQRRDRKTDD